MPLYYLEGINKPEMTMRSMTIIFYSNDATQAVLLAKTERDAKRAAMLRDASMFWGETEECETVWIMPNVMRHHRDRIKESYGDKALELTEEEVPPVGSEASSPAKVAPTRRPPPPPPLPKEAALPERGITATVEGEVDYRNMTNKELRELASSRGISTRNATNKDQLVQLLAGQAT